MKNIILKFIKVVIILGILASVIKSTTLYITSFQEIQSFSYSYGSYHEGEWSYYIVREDEKVMLYTELFNGANGEELECEIDPIVLKDISKIVRKYGIYKWGVFDSFNFGMLDDYGFRINIKYDIGQITSSGYGMTSFNYRMGHWKLVEYLEKLVQEQTYKN